MNEKLLKNIAVQLRKPQGELAVQVGEKMNVGNLQINLLTIDALDLKGSENILEIGMGNGFFVKNILLKHPNVKYSGCDYSEIMVQQAKIINAEFISAGRAQFHQTSAHELPFENATFDKVFTINTIYFWDEASIVLAEISRVLKPKGQIIIAIRPRVTMQHYPFIKYGFNMFSKEELAALLTENNFKPINILEKSEPPQEIGGKTVPVEALVVCAEK